MKTLKFKPYLVEQILAGTKTSTWRLFDDKNIQVGDVIDVFNKENGDQFGVVTVTSVRVKTLGTLEESDWEGHERYESEEAMYAEYRSYYGDTIGPDSEIKLIDFTFEPKRYKKCVVVDVDDNVLGAEYLAIVHEKGLIRRVARVFVFDESGQLLVQQRSNKVFMPLLLDQSAAGHVDMGESYEECARRELAEELGLIDFPLLPVGKPVLVKNQYCGMFKVVVPNDTRIVFNEDEVGEVKWYMPHELTTAMTNNPDRFTTTFREMWTMFGEDLQKA